MQCNFLYFQYLLQPVPILSQLEIFSAGFDLLIFIESEQEIEKEDWRTFLMELYVAFLIFVVLFMGEFVRLFTEIIEFLFKSF